MKVTGIPKPVVRWFTKDKQIVQTSEVTIEEEEEDVVTLVIKKMKPEFIGPITCEAHNELGVISTSTVLNFPGNFSVLFNYSVSRIVYYMIESTCSMCEISRHIFYFSAPYKAVEIMVVRALLLNSHFSLFLLPILYVF